MKFKGIGIINGKSDEIAITAETKDDAFKKMQEMGYKNITIVESASIFQRRSVKTKDISMCFRQLAAFAEAGESFPVSLASVADVSKNRLLKDALLDIKRKVEGGKSIASAFADYKFFPPIVVNLLRVGEKSGEMEKTLNELAKYLQQVYNIEQGVSSAMMYPKIITVVMCLAMAFVVAKILPQFKSFYTDMHIEMPFMTKMLYAFSDFINNQWFIAIPAVLAIVYFIKNINKYMPVFYDNAVIKLPVVKKIMINLYMFRFAKTMQILNASGVETIDALKLTADTMENHLYKNIIKDAIPKVEAGGGITSSIRRCDKDGIYDGMVIAFLQTGESTDNIDGLMGKASDFYQRNLNTAIDNFGKAIEPIILVIIACFVFVLVSSVYLPIFRMSQISNQQ